MVQPIQYTVQAPSAFESLVSGLKLGTSLQEMQAQRALREQQALKIQADMEQKRQQQELLVQLRQKPFDQWTSEDVTSASMLMPPEGLTFLKGQMDRMSTEERRARALTLGQLASVAMMGDAERTAAAFDERIEAETNPREKEALRVQKQTALTRPGDLAKLYSVMLGGMGEEGKGVVANLIKLHALEPGAAADVRIKEAEAIIKEVEAKFSPETVGAKLGLTQAQIEQAKSAARASDAAARKSGADAERAKAEAAQMAAGVIPAEKRPEAERNFRNEYNDRTKGYQDIKSSYGRILSVSEPKTEDEEGPADLALIFNFMKMQDPGSTVNTGEFANAQNAAGVPDRIRNLWNNLLTGGRLNPNQRKAFRGQAENIYKSALQQESTVRSGIERIAKGYGLSPENIFYTPTEVAPVAPVAAGAGQRNITQSFSQRPQSAPTPAQTPTPAAGGAQRNVKVDY